MADVLAVAQVAGRSYGQKADESDRLTHAGIVRTASGTADVYTDNNVTSVSIGGGSGLTGSTAVSINGGSGGGVSVTAGASQDITFDARGMSTSITLNQTGNTDLNSAFVSAGVTSIVAALNSIQDGTVSVPGTPIVNTYTVTANEANHVIDIGQAANPPFFIVLNQAMYSSLEGWFTVSTTTFANDTWTWQDQGAPGQLEMSDNVLTWHY